MTPFKLIAKREDVLKTVPPRIEVFNHSGKKRLATIFADEHGIKGEDGYIFYESELKALLDLKSLFWTIYNSLIELQELVLNPVIERQ